MAIFFDSLLQKVIFVMTKKLKKPGNNEVQSY